MIFGKLPNSDLRSVRLRLAGRHGRCLEQLGRGPGLLRVAAVGSAAAHLCPVGAGAVSGQRFETLGVSGAKLGKVGHLDGKPTAKASADLW